MRLVALGLVPLVLAGCGAKYKPTDPVVGEFRRTQANPVHKPHDQLTYMIGGPVTEAPLVPVMAFGAAFDLDIAVMSSDADLDMIEFARMNVPFGDGYVWMALETKTDSGAQTLLANLDPEQLARFMPELPIARQSVKMELDDKVTESAIDVHLAYDGPMGHVDATIVGDPPLKTARHRNGRTFTHSQNELLAVLDLAASESLFRADVKIDDKGLAQRKIAGLVPGRFAMVQTQGGLAAGQFKVVPTQDAYGSKALGAVTVHRPGDEPVAKPAPDVLLKVAITTNVGPITDCWKARVAEQADLKGGVLGFEWTLESGAVKGVKAKAIEGSTFVDDKLTACVSGVIGGWTLDPSVHGSAWWSYNFVPADTTVEDGAGPTVKLGDGGSTLTEPPPAPPITPEGDTPAPVPNPDALPEEGAPAPEPAVMAEPSFKSFTTIHPRPDGSSVEMNWLVTVQGDRLTASTTDELRTLSYHYRLNSGAYAELYSITVEQYGRATPVTAVTFTPPIPDLRWQFSGKRTSSFVIDVNGQQAHAVGEVTASWSDNGPRLLIEPTEPSWAAARPLLSDIVFNRTDGTVDVTIQRGGK